MSSGIKLDVTLYIEIGDIEYQPAIERYYPGSVATWHNPGEGSEIDISNIVRIHNGPKEIGVTTWNVLMLELAAHRGYSLVKANEHLENLLHSAADEAAADWEPDYPERDDD